MKLRRKENIGIESLLPFLIWWLLWREIVLDGSSCRCLISFKGSGRVLIELKISRSRVDSISFPQPAFAVKPHLSMPLRSAHVYTSKKVYLVFLRWSNAEENIPYLKSNGRAGDIFREQIRD